MADKASQIEVAGRTLRVTNLDKVMYPHTGTTKGDVIDYYRAVAPWFVPHAARRPATRKRWVHGVEGPAFFTKNADSGTPAWIATVGITHSKDTLRYPLVDDAATLVFLAQLAALEIHVPQWRFTDALQPANPDRLVLDLDPGEGAGLAECVEVALIVKDILDGVGLTSVPVTSGSKGIHLYAGLDGTFSSDDANQFARQLAVALEASHPKLVVADMRKELRGGKVLLDWSQNSGSKTTVAPYSLRGRQHPYVAAPRTWDEIGAGLEQLSYTDVLERLRSIGDPLAVLLPGAAALPGGSAAPDGSQDRPDRLAAYRSMRDAGRTPEPVPADPPEPTSGNSFVIQEHHARRLHHDFRLEHDGVLVSWAVPKLTPLDPKTNHLAVQTEDHPLAYGSFSGTIPRGEYGAGDVTIWDAGTYEAEKWRDGKEVIVTLHGRPDGGLGGVPRRYALINTGSRGSRAGRGAKSGRAATGAGAGAGAGGGDADETQARDDKNWLIHLMAPRDGASGQPPELRPHPAPTAPRSGDPTTDRTGTVLGRVSSAGSDGTRQLQGPFTLADLPVPEAMLAAPAQPADLTGDDWHFEVKWDGYRALAAVAGGEVRLGSRRGNDFTATYPELGELTTLLGGRAAVLDGEIVALGPDGRSHFELLQNHGRQAAPAHYMAFDLLWLDGVSLLGRSYLERRAALEELLTDGRFVHVPSTFGTDRELALSASTELQLEGLVAKRARSAYYPGRRSQSWLKLKNVRHADVIVFGWTPGEGNRAGRIGALLLAVNGPDGLVYVGRAGSGFTEAALADARARLDVIETPSPPIAGVPRQDAKGAHWVEPILVGEVAFAGYSDSGRLRHPVWRGWRPDRTPDEVVRED